MKRRFTIIMLFGFIGALLVAGCDDVVKDATFREWCGDTLCAWKLEAGSIRKAATWHKNDHGVELVETPTAISQTTDKAPKCLTFTTIADVEPSAQVTIGLDFNRDGTIDVEQPIAATGFREAKTQVTAPTYYEGVRFVITKKGVGRAVLAQIRVQSGEKCTAPPVVLRDLPIGSPCSEAEGATVCRSGICCSNLCADCCVGRPGGGNAKCENDAATCESVNAPNIRGFFQPALPAQCAPGEGLAPADAECLDDADCASGVCDGAELRSFRAGGDGGVEECAHDFPDAGGQGCAFYFARGGRCR